MKTFRSRFPFSDASPWMTGTAIFAIFWIVARAAVQSITIDEADTYLGFVSRLAPFHWYPAANNQVLNSALIRLITSIFGTSSLTMRAPALMGGVLYISAVYVFCALLRVRAVLQLALFSCLVLNPFVMDYLVAARGYALALGFLMWAILIPAVSFSRSEVRPAEVTNACAWTSVCMALSFAGNFSFAFIDASVLLTVWIWASRRENSSVQRSLTLLGACTLPGLVVSLFLTLSVVLRFPVSQFVYGSKSLQQTFSSVIHASFYQLNDNILSPLILPAFEHLRRFLLPALGIFCLGQAVAMFQNRASRKDENAWRWSLCFAVAGAVLIAVGLHRFCYRLFHILMPQNRTALFLAVLPVAAAGVAASISLPSRISNICRRGITLALCAIAIYFVSCLRLTYFEEWVWNSDANRVYSVLAYYNHNYGVRDIVCAWNFTAVLNYYRKVSGHESFSEFQSSFEYPTGKDIYVLIGGLDQGFIDRQRLKVVYHGELSDAIVAIRPDLEGAPAIQPK